MSSSVQDETLRRDMAVLFRPEKSAPQRSDAPMAMNAPLPAPSAAAVAAAPRASARAMPSIRVGDFVGPVELVSDHTLELGRSVQHKANRAAHKMARALIAAKPDVSNAELTEATLLAVFEAADQPGVFKPVLGSRKVFATDEMSAGCRLGRSNVTLMLDFTIRTMAIPSAAIREICELFYTPRTKATSGANGCVEGTLDLCVEDAFRMAEKFELSVDLVLDVAEHASEALVDGRRTAPFISCVVIRPELPRTSQENACELVCVSGRRDTTLVFPDDGLRTTLNRIGLDNSHWAGWIERPKHSARPVIGFYAHLRTFGINHLKKISRLLKDVPKFDEAWYRSFKALLTGTCNERLIVFLSDAILNAVKSGKPSVLRFFREKVDLPITYPIPDDADEFGYAAPVDDSWVDAEWARVSHKKFELTQSRVCKSCRVAEVNRCCAYCGEPRTCSDACHTFDVEQSDHLRTCRIFSKHAQAPPGGLLPGASK